MFKKKSLHLLPQLLDILTIYARERERERERERDREREREREGGYFHFNPILCIVPS